MNISTSRNPAWHDHETDKGRSGIRPYGYYQLSRDPEPMIAALEKTLKTQAKEKP